MSKLPAFTLGIEEEYQIIDPQTRDLRSYIQKILDDGKVILKEQIKYEMHQSVIEVGTNICKNVDEARTDVTNLRRTIAHLAGQQGLVIGAAGTHPFALWQEQPITPHPRYYEIVNEMQEAARSNLIFGLHVHVGIENRKIGLHLMNTVAYLLPHIFALSANSPFWEGRNTGYKSFRVKVFDKFPRTGLPYPFDSLADYDGYIDLLIKTKCIDNAKKIWWDLRLHPFFDTIEFRICDLPMLVDETIALAALMQAVIAKTYKLMKANLAFRSYSRTLINENRWRASRYGLDGKLIDFGREEEVDTKALIYELLDFVDDVVDELGSRHEINYIPKILENGTGADRQLKVYEQSGGDLKKVVDYIVSQTNQGLS
jgi:carboxylate-amine ligase